MSSQRTNTLGGFSPLFRGMYSDQHLRVSDAERQTVTDRLSEHYAAGRLDQAEFDDRVGRAMNAKTRADLSGLFSDLPETGAPAVADHARGRRRRHPVLVFVLLVPVHHGDRARGAVGDPALAVGGVSRARPVVRHRHGRPAPPAPGQRKPLKTFWPNGTWFHPRDLHRSAPGRDRVRVPAVGLA